jgi:hypothetical protein
MSAKKAAKREKAAMAAAAGATSSGIAPTVKGGAQSGAAQREASRVAAMRSEAELDRMRRLRAVDEEPMPLPEIELPELPAWFPPIVRFLIMLVILAGAYKIRLLAIQNYGTVIHEYDPWFNYRAVRERPAFFSLGIATL